MTYSIHTSQALVKDGIRWKVVDGNKIKIWTEPWLQDSQNSYIVSPHIDGLADLTVSSLIHSSTAT